MARAEVITSAKNPLLKEIRRALTRGTLTADGLCVAETFHLLEEALRSGLQVSIVVTAEGVRRTVERFLEDLQGVRLLVLPDEMFQELSATEAAQGVMTLARPPQWTMEQVLRGLSMVVVLDGVQDPGNAGAMVRAAEAFGATGVVFLKGTVSPWNPKTLRASAGSLFRVPILEGIEATVLRSELEQRRTNVFIAVPRGGVALRDADLTRRCAIVVGSEGRGVSEEMRGAGVDLHIPTKGVESLNAGVAAGILLYESWRQRSVT